MTEINYSSLLRELVEEYFEHRMSRVEYLAQRRALLDRIDREFNGEGISSGWPEPDAQDASPDLDTSQVITLVPSTPPNKP